MYGFNFSCNTWHRYHSFLGDICSWVRQETTTPRPNPDSLISVSKLMFCSKPLVLLFVWMPSDMHHPPKHCWRWKKSLDDGTFMMQNKFSSRPLCQPGDGEKPSSQDVVCWKGWKSIFSNTFDSSSPSTSHVWENAARLCLKLRKCLVDWRNSTKLSISMQRGLEPTIVRDMFWRCQGKSIFSQSAVRFLFLPFWALERALTADVSQVGEGSGLKGSGQKLASGKYAHTEKNEEF